MTYRFCCNNCKSMYRDFGEPMCALTSMPVSNIEQYSCDRYTPITWVKQPKPELGKIPIEMQLKGPILIVGVSGFIGASLYHHLRQFRADVYGCSRNPYSWRLQDASDLMFADITNYDQMKHMLGFLKPATIFNLSTYGGTSIQTDSTQIYNINYMGTNNLLRILKEIGYDAFVQAGSQSEYGLNCSGPKETDTLIPNSDYAVAKVAVSYLVKYYGQVLKFPVVDLRLYSIFGALEDKERLIPRIIECGKHGCYPPLVDKTISRDFVYIDDCIEALIKAAINVDKVKGWVINIASGTETTMYGVASIAQRIFNMKMEPVFASMPSRQWDLSEWWGDATIAKEKLGWEAKTTLEEGIRRIVG